MNAYDNILIPLKRRFFIATALLFVVAIACVTQMRSRRQLEKTSDDVIRAQAGLTRVKVANANRKQALAAIRSQLDQNTQQNSPEMVLYRKVDELAANLNPDGMTTSSIENKGGEATLLFTLDFNNPDFNALLNTVSTLHAATFPMTPVSAITVSQSDGKGSSGVSYKVSGKIITSVKAKP